MNEVLEKIMVKILQWQKKLRHQLICFIYKILECKTKLIKPETCAQKFGPA